jgi:hypothetical protein
VWDGIETREVGSILMVSIFECIGDDCVRGVDVSLMSTSLVLADFLGRRPNEFLLS